MMKNKWMKDPYLKDSKQNYLYLFNIYRKPRNPNSRRNFSNRKMSSGKKHPRFIKNNRRSYI